MRKKKESKLKKTAQKITGKLMNIQTTDHYDMSTQEKREVNVVINVERARIAKATTLERFKENDQYYMNNHYAKEQLEVFINEEGWDFVPPVLPDPFIQVESLITKELPSFEFKAKDPRMTQEQATQREHAVSYVLENNDMEEMNLENERAMNKLGTAFWKVSWDNNKHIGGHSGDVGVGNPDSADILPDPSAKNIEACEFIAYEYPLHIQAAKRMFPDKKEDLSKLLSNEGTLRNTDVYEANTFDTMDSDTVGIVEYWYRDAVGDIALSVLAIAETGYLELKHVDKYWEKTRHSHNQMYPIVRYRRIPIAKDFWGRGEIDFIKDLVDAADREFITAIMNDMLSGNDIVLADEGAFQDGFVPVAKPGTIWYKKQDKNVTRLGGSAFNGNELNMVTFLHEKIQEVNRNYASSLGKEPDRVTAASGIMQLNEKAERQTEIKAFGRLLGFERLARLIDWHILEFYDDERMILVHGAKDEEDSFESFKPSEMGIQENTSNQFDFEKGELEDTLGDESSETAKSLTESEDVYFPNIDVSIRAGSPLEQSKSLTLAVTQELAMLQITPQNFEIIKSLIDLLEIPNGKKIKESIDKQMDTDREAALMEQQAKQQMLQGESQEQIPMEEGVPQEADVEQLINDLMDILPQEIIEILNNMDEEERLDLLMQMIELSPDELATFIQNILREEGVA